MPSMGNNPSILLEPKSDKYNKPESVIPLYQVIREHLLCIVLLIHIFALLAMHM